MTLCCFSANRYDLGLSNEPLFIIMGQGAAKLLPFKVGGQKKIPPRHISNPILLSKQEASKAIFLRCPSHFLTQTETIAKSEGYLALHLKCLFYKFLKTANFQSHFHFRRLFKRPYLYMEWECSYVSARARSSLQRRGTGHGLLFTG